MRKLGISDARQFVLHPANRRRRPEQQDGRRHHRSRQTTREATDHALAGAVVRTRHDNAIQRHQQQAAGDQHQGAEAEESLGVHHVYWGGIRSRVARPQLPHLLWERGRTDIQADTFYTTQRPRVVAPRHELTRELDADASGGGSETARD